MKIMYVSYGGGHANIIKSIYPVLSPYEDITQIVLALTAAPKLFSSYQIPYFTLSHYLELFEDKNVIVQNGKHLISQSYDPQPGIDKNEIELYLGLGYTDLAREKGNEEAERLFQKDGKTAFCPVDAMKVILRNENPDVVVITCSVRMEKAAGIAANELGIPVVQIESLPEYPDRVCECVKCVMNEYAKQFGIDQWNIPEDTLVITGQPVFEEDLLIDPAVQEQVNESLGIKSYENTLLYIEQPGLTEIPIIEKALFTYAMNHQNTLVICKLHPNQPFDSSTETASITNFIRIKDIPIKYLISLCDVAITRDSTAGLETAIMGKPVVSALFSKPEIFFSKFGISIDVYSVEDMIKMVNQCLDTQSAVSRKLSQGRDRFMTMPGAATNIANVIVHEGSKKRTQRN